MDKYVYSRVSEESAASNFRVREFRSNGFYCNRKENFASYIIHKCSSQLTSAPTRQKFSHSEDGGSIFLGNHGRNTLLYTASEPGRP
jgi:hypothetical protein